MFSSRYPECSVRRAAILAAAVIVGVLAGPRPSQAQLANPTIVGTLTNFDVRNEMEIEAEGFEIQIEGIEINDITRLFGESLAGVCFTRFCAPIVTEFPGGVIVRWSAFFDPRTGNRESRLKITGTVVGPRTPVATLPFVSGEQCWALGLAEAYPASGCEHFGVSLSRNPTKTTYRWLVADPTDPANLIPAPAGPVAVPTPTVSVEPVDPAKPELGQAVVHEIRGAPSRIGKQYGDAEWVKIYKLDVGRKVDLEELMRGNAVVPNDTNAETDWKLVQHNRNSKGNSGVLRSKSGSGSSSHAVVRRYEFYHFTGQYDPDSHEAVCADGQCDAPSAGEIGAFIGSQMAAANLQAQARIALDRTFVGAGGVVTATVSDGPAVPGDWLGLYDGTGGLVTSYRDWKYLNGTHGKPAVGGVANAVVPFTLPETPGTYTLRLFNSGTFNVAATSAPITVATPRLTVNATTVAAGDTVTATIENAPGAAGDWIGLFDAASAAANYREWKYLNGSHDKPAAGSSAADVTFALPSTPGEYDLRLFAAGSYAVVATSAHITVTASGAGTPTPTTVQVSATEVHPGEKVTATIAAGPGTPGDWIGLFDVNGGVTNYLQWQYLNGTQSKPGAGSAAATTQFTMPAVPGTYNLRLFANSSYTLAATSPSITVMAPTIVLGSDAVSAGGTVTATIANAPGKPGDWIGLYDAAGNAQEYRQWQYLNGSQSKPAAGVTSAVLSFTAPSAAGTYNVRLFSAGTFVLLATSPSFSVP